MPKGEDTSERILDAAQAMAQKRGYNGVSYRDISQVVGVRTASIHYHFASKEILFTALAERYRTTIMERHAVQDVFSRSMPGATSLNSRPSEESLKTHLSVR